MAELFRAMSPQIFPSHAPPIRQPVTDGILILSLIQLKNLAKQDAETLPLPPGSSSLQHQAQCLQVIHQTNKQFHQHLKAEQLDRNRLHFFVVHLHNDFSILCYLLFSSVGTISISDTAVKNSATSPLINPNPKLNHTPSALKLPCAAAPKLRHSTPEGTVGPPRAKANNSANIDLHSSTNTLETPQITAQNLTLKIFIP